MKRLAADHNLDNQTVQELPEQLGQNSLSSVADLGTFAEHLGMTTKR